VSGARHRRHRQRQGCALMVSSDSANESVPSPNVIVVWICPNPGANQVVAVSLASSAGFV